MINRPRGTRDILYPKSFLYQKINFLISDFLNSNNYKQIIFPTYENKEIFFSSLGETTDVIRKEMFLFNDKKGREMALRPEGTVCVVRSVCQNNLLNSNHPLKLFYWANMFRYERPQQGRYREFWQLGVEIINSSGILADLEALLIAKSILENLGINDLSFSINYLGNEETRSRFKNYLKDSLKNDFHLLCKDCVYRYSNNPLRIMDCDLCNSIESIPDYSKSWSDEDCKYVNKITNSLNKIDLKYNIDQKLIRGLDYYTGITFEVKLLNEGKTLIGGGRYDDLFNKFINKKVPSIGFALGVDRLVDFFYDSLYKNFEQYMELDLLLISIDESTNFELFPLREKILKKKKDLIVELNLEEKGKKSFDLINFYNPKLTLIVGKKELESNFFTLKRNLDKKEFIISKNDVVDWISNYFNNINN
ncbi:MAG: Histidine--tRNA ligase [Mycoplasmataceae bacterium]|nr:MAG: Histidine--tRNA ligase [Mycoplasmataceae bacterium]